MLGMWSDINDDFVRVNCLCIDIVCNVVDVILSILFVMNGKLL